MTETKVRIVVELDLDIADNIDVKDVLDDMGYDFVSNTKQARIVDYQILDYEFIE